MRIAIARDGRVDYLDHGDLNLDGLTRRRRASHIEPFHFWKRQAFRILRLCVPDESRAAEWSRGWRTLWRVNLSPSRGPIRGPFRCRSKAIECEEQWLMANRMGGEQCVRCSDYLIATDCGLFLDRARVCERCYVRQLATDGISDSYWRGT